VATLPSPDELSATSGSRTRRIEAIAPWIVGLLLATPVLVAFYPPMTDLAFHEAAIGILRHFGDTTMFPPGLYRMNLGEPNQLFHMVGWGLSYVMSTRWAVKLLVAAAVAALPITAARFARHVGASPIAALVVAPMALGWLFSWGLITNLIGVSALLFVLPVLDRFSARPSARLGLLVIGSILLLYFAHMAMMFVFAGVALGFAVLRPWSWKQALWGVVPFVATLLVTLGELRLQERFMTPTVRAMPNLWQAPKAKIKGIPYLVLPATDFTVQLCMLGLCVLAIAAFFWLRTKERRESASPSAAKDASRLQRAKAWGLRYRWECVAGVGFIAYMTFPVSLKGATLVYQRWFPPAFAILAVVACPRDLWTRAGRIARVSAFVLPIATLLVAWPSFADSDREYRDVDKLISQIEPGSAVAEMDLGPWVVPRTYSLGPADGRALATRGGRLVYAFTDSPVSPVVLRRKYQWTESLIRIGFDSWHFTPAHDLKRFRYALVRTQDPGLKVMVAYVLAPDVTYVDEQGDWVLFRSKHDVVPLESPDVPMDDPKPEDMREKIRNLVESLRDRPDTPNVEIPPEKTPDNVGPNGQPL
jgi:hypothetical protein